MEHDQDALPRHHIAIQLGQTEAPSDIRDQGKAAKEVHWLQTQNHPRGSRPYKPEPSQRLKQLTTSEAKTNTQPGLRRLAQVAHQRTGRKGRQRIEMALCALEGKNEKSR